MQCLVLKSNESEISEIKKLGKSLGVDRVELKKAQFYDYKKGNPLMPESGKWARYRRASAGQEFVIRNPLRNRCFRMWSGCVITWDGKVVPCCYDKDAEHVMGDLNTQSFEEVWKGKKFAAFRRQILHNRKDIPMCRNCGQIW